MWQLSKKVLNQSARVSRRLLFNLHQDHNSSNSLRDHSKDHPQDGQDPKDSHKAHHVGDQPDVQDVGLRPAEASWAVPWTQ